MNFRTKLLITLTFAACQAVVLGCSDPAAEIPADHSVQNPLGTTPNPDIQATPPPKNETPQMTDSSKASNFMEEKMREATTQGK